MTDRIEEPTPEVSTVEYWQRRALQAEKENRQLEEENSHLRQQLLTDPKTGVENIISHTMAMREIVNSFYEEEPTYENDQIKSVRLVMVDGNDFGLINKYVSHRVGDLAIKEFVEASKGKGFRVFRIGGDEFILVKIGYESGPEVTDQTILNDLIELSDEYQERIYDLGIADKPVFSNALIGGISFGVSKIPDGELRTVKTVRKLKQKLRTLKAFIESHEAEFIDKEPEDSIQARYNLLKEEEHETNTKLQLILKNTKIQERRESRVSMLLVNANNTLQEAKAQKELDKKKVTNDCSSIVVDQVYKRLDEIENDPIKLQDLCAQFEIIKQENTPPRLESINRILAILGYISGDYVRTNAEDTEKDKVNLDYKRALRLHYNSIIEVFTKYPSLKKILIAEYTQAIKPRITLIAKKKKITYIKVRKEQSVIARRKGDSI